MKDTIINEFLNRANTNKDANVDLNRNEKIYHFITCNTSDLGRYMKTIKTHGLCSPKAIFDLDMDLFMETSYEVYKERAATYLKKSVKKVTANDIINYLDNSATRKGRGFSSSTIFFSFIPFNRLSEEVKNKVKPIIHLSVDIKTVQNYTPLLVMKGTVKTINWSEIKSDRFIKWVEKESIKESTNKTRIYAHIPHLGVADVYQIPFRNLAITPEIYT